MADDTDVNQSEGGGTRPPDPGDTAQVESLVNGGQEETHWDGRKEQEASKGDDSYRNQFITVMSRRAKKISGRGAGQAGVENNKRGGQNRGGFRGGYRGGHENERPMRGARGGNTRRGAFTNFRKPMDIVRLDDSEDEAQREEEPREPME